LDKRRTNIAEPPSNTDEPFEHQVDLNGVALANYFSDPHFRANLERLWEVKVLMAVDGFPDLATLRAAGVRRTRPDQNR
jgi:hypothetical protein